MNALELSNVAATLASGGVWCPPNPIDKLIDRNGNEVAVTTETCDQVVPEGLANTLSNAMSKDDTGGTAAGSAGSAGWNLPMSGKTGTTEAHRSSGFVGFTNHYAAANYIYDDSPNPSDLCSWPLRHCGDGDLYGGNEPARTWFTAMKPIANSFGDVSAAAHRSALRRRRPRLAGAQRLRAGAGHRTPAPQGRRFPGRRPDQLGQQQRPHGEVVGTSPSGQTVPGFDRHDPGQQRHPAGTAATTAGSAAATHPGVDGSHRSSARRWWRFRACRRSRFRCWLRRRRRRRRAGCAVFTGLSTS